MFGASFYPEPSESLFSSPWCLLSLSPLERERVHPCKEDAQGDDPGTAEVRVTWKSHKNIIRGRAMGRDPTVADPDHPVIGVNL